MSFSIQNHNLLPISSLSSLLSITGFHLSSCKIFTVGKITVISKTVVAKTQFCHFSSNTLFVLFIRPLRHLWFSLFVNFFFFVCLRMRKVETFGEVAAIFAERLRRSAGWQLSAFSSRNYNASSSAFITNIAVVASFSPLPISQKCHSRFI